MGELNTFRPDYAVPPGWVLEEHLEARGWTQAELARRCDRSPKLISQIVAGKAPIEPITALQFENVLGLKAEIWLGLENDFQLHKARQAEAERAAAHANWAKAFPVRELVKRRLLPETKGDADLVQSLCRFFGIATPEALDSRFTELQGSFRHSPTFDNNVYSVKTWLRIGELQALSLGPCRSFDKGLFLDALTQIRNTTAIGFSAAIIAARQLSREAGVTVLTVPPLPGLSVSGVAFWPTQDYPVIMLTVRHLRDDHLWFSFFHEAAHLLLHSRRTVYLDDGKAGHDAPEEREADQWAGNFLIPSEYRSALKRVGDLSSVPAKKAAVRELAKQLGIAPGIVVGRLQYERIVPWNLLNDLTVKLTW
jgi:HTH-type transcriptional regulator/antitoxin HigA